MLERDRQRDGRDEVREMMWPTVRPYLHVRPCNGFRQAAAVGGYTIHKLDYS
jgi:hypothetical protein